MAFQDDLAKHVEQVRGRIPHVTGEESTKQALVVPLLQVLGFDVFDPREIRPEYTADFAVKKAGQFEKVDYAVYLNGAIALFIECKPIGAALDDHSGQLSRYFNATPGCRVAWITDGARIRMYTDLQQPNIMDAKPWLDIDLLNLKPNDIDSLRRFRRADFVPEEIVRLAEEMVYYSAMLAVVSAQLREPTESFVRWIAGELPAAGRVTTKLVERLSPILRKALHSAIVEHVARSFERPAEPVTAPVPEPVAPAPEPVSVATAEGRAGIVTTAEELEVARQVSEWVHEVWPDVPVVPRDSKSYFMLHQGNVRKWFMRVQLDRRPAWVQLRHLKVEEARTLAPGLEVADLAQGGIRLTLPALADLPKMRSAIIQAFAREAARVGDDPSDDS